MTEKNFEDFLKKAAKSYNAPPARTPREEMWTAIQAKRSAGPRVVYGGGSTAPAPAARRFGTRVWMGAAAAAMLLVATGVGIGRFTARPTERVPGVVAPPIQADPIVIAGAGSESTTGIEAGGEAGRGSDRRGSRSESERVGPSATSSQRSATSVNPKPSDVASGATPSQRAPISAYQLATMQHLTEAEALLTSFRARSPADQQMDAQLGTWARQLLSNTRLLLDSPVANDPQRRPLLEDLELVLVQIVQLSPGSTPQDRELIEKTLQHDHVMTRLRTAIPAGQQHGS
jgi:hypothetical protein